MSYLENLSYKELQLMAKQRKIPANLKRTFLIAALDAYENGNMVRMDEIKVQNTRSRGKRSSKSMAESPDWVPRKSRSKKSHVHEKSEKTDKNKRPQELVPYRSTAAAAAAALYYKNKSGSYLENAVQNRFPSVFNRMAAAADAQGYADSMVTDCSPPSHSLSNFFPVNCSSPYPNSIPAIMQRNAAALQETFNCPENGSCSLFCNSSPSLYRAQFFHQSIMAGYENGYHSFPSETAVSHSQAPQNVRLYESNYFGTVSETNYDHFRMYAGTAKKSASAAINEGEYPNYVLPDIPQLEGGGAENGADLSTTTWDHNSSRNLSENGTQNPGEYDYRRKLHLNKSVVDSASIDAEFDSNSDAETLSLPEEIANLFDSDNDNNNNNGSSGGDGSNNNNNNSRNTTQQQIAPLLSSVNFQTKSSDYYSSEVAAPPPPFTSPSNRRNEPGNLSAMKVISENVAEAEKVVATEQVPNNNGDQGTDEGDVLMHLHHPMSNVNRRFLSECNVLPSIATLLPSQYPVQPSYEFYSPYKEGYSVGRMSSRGCGNFVSSVYEESCHQYSSSNCESSVADSSQTNESFLSEGEKSTAATKGGSLRNYDMPYLPVMVGNGGVDSLKYSILKNLSSNESSTCTTASNGSPSFSADVVVTSSVVDEKTNSLSLTPLDCINKALDEIHGLNQKTDNETSLDAMKKVETNGTPPTGESYVIKKLKNFFKSD